MKIVYSDMKMHTWNSDKNGYVLDNKDYAVCFELSHVIEVMLSGLSQV